MSPPPSLPLKASEIGEALTEDNLARLLESFLLQSAYISIQYAKCREDRE